MNEANAEAVSQTLGIRATSGGLRPELPSQPRPVGNAHCERLHELHQKNHRLAGVVAVAPKGVDDLQLAGNVALAFERSARPVPGIRGNHRVP
jgi:hypothetical protein